MTRQSCARGSRRRWAASQSDEEVADEFSCDPSIREHVPDKKVVPSSVLRGVRQAICDVLRKQGGNGSGFVRWTICTTAPASCGVTVGPATAVDLAVGVAACNRDDQR